MVRPSMGFAYLPRIRRRANNGYAQHHSSGHSALKLEGRAPLVCDGAAAEAMFGSGFRRGDSGKTPTGEYVGWHFAELSRSAHPIAKYRSHSPEPTRCN